MPLIVETGDLSEPTANSYIDLAYATAYFEGRNPPDEWTCLNVDEQEAAVLYAMDYLESKFNFKGCLESLEQPLSFPRSVIFDKDSRKLNGQGVIPAPIKNALCELALAHVTGPGLFYTQSAEDSRITSESVGDRSVTLSKGGGYTTPKLVTVLLRPYVLHSSSIIPLVRG